MTVVFRNLELTKFFLFGLAISFTFIFCQKLFEVAYIISTSLLWICLMVGLPLGAALFNRYRKSLVHNMGILFALSLIWLLLVLQYTVSASGVVFLQVVPETGKIFPLFFHQLKLGLIGFLPLWISLGILEVHLFESLSKDKKVSPWPTYVAFIVGLASAQLVHSFILANPSPTHLGTLGIVTMLAYLFGFVDNSRKTKVFVTLLLTCLIALFQTNIFYGLDPWRYYKTQKENQGISLVHDEWRSSMRFSVVKSHNYLHGYYNGVFHWSVLPQAKPGVFFPNQLPAQLVAKNSSIALLGAGGGGQLVDLLASQPKILYSVDIVEGLFEKMSQLGVVSFDDKRIKKVTQDARQFMLQFQTDKAEKLDAVILAHTESIFSLAKSMHEPADHLFTKEAFNEYKKSLSDSGFVLVMKPMRYMEKLIGSYQHTMNSAGLNTKLYETQGLYFLVGTKSKKSLSALNSIFQSNELNPIEKPPSSEFVITDDNPTIAKILWLESEYIRPSTGILMSLPFLFTFVSFLLRKKWKITLQQSLSATLCGMNYTFILLGLQLLMVLKLSLPLEAYNLTTLVFLSLIAVGSFLERRLSLYFLAIASIVFAGYWSGMGASFTVLMLLALISGQFFPRLIICFKERIFALFVFDGVGAALAGIVFFFVPVLYGISTFFMILCTTFALTGMTILLHSKSKMTT